MALGSQKSPLCDLDKKAKQLTVRIAVLKLQLRIHHILLSRWAGEQVIWIA